jgi:hypothetical protein
MMKNFKLCIIVFLIALSTTSSAWAKSFSSKEGGFSIYLPDEWTPMPDGHSIDISQEGKILSEEDIDIFAINGMYLPFLDQTAHKAGKSRGLLVTKQAISDYGGVFSGKNTKEISREFVEPMKGDSRLKGEVKSEIRKFGGLEWAKVSWKTEEYDSNNKNGFLTLCNNTQYFTVRDGFIYVFLYVADERIADEPLFDKIMGSVKLQ